MIGSMAGDASRTLRRRLIDGREPIVRHQSRILKALRRCLYVLVALVALFCAWTVAREWPLISLGWGRGQDDCSFGTVSNARYRELLAHARKLEGRLGDPFLANIPGLGGGSGLQHRFDMLSSEMTSVEERIAAMHALMRAAGTQFYWLYPDEQSPFGTPQPPDRNRVAFGYSRFVPRGLLYLCLIGCFQLGGANFQITPTGLPLYRPNSFRFTQGYSWTFKHAAWPRPRSRAHPTCPPVPLPGWSDAYLNWSRTQNL